MSKEFDDITLYYWINGKVKACPDNVIIQSVLCVDILSEKPTGRYGMWDKNTESNWVSFPFEHFPPEFKLQLLLLGVT